jgi:NAD kinase
MTATRYETAVIVSRKTELEELVARFATAPQARFYLEHAGQDFERIQAAHERYASVMSRVRAAVPRRMKCQRLDRSSLPQLTFGPDDLVIVVGQDGLVSNTAKYLDGQPMLAVNPDPATYDGILLPFDVDSFGAALQRTLAGASTIKRITLAQTTLNDGQKLLAFNDFFIGAASHVSARYEIRSGGRVEFQSSSGIIVSTGAGSTGWLQSVYRGAAGIVEALGGRVIPPPRGGRLDWSTEQLVFAVREPFPSRATGTSIVYGTITQDRPLQVTSHMGCNGVIFSDGIESDYLAFNHGATASITVAPRKAALVVDGSEAMSSLPRRRHGGKGRRAQAEAAA